ncbi:DUF3011 domain-containing protein [Tahibacter harae]|uniref:DUF3011 domain-containing protein n=1 Tax=Tahibacter harae TaxID=2963937 RepID=A0ABT1QMP5_9GAMM|nr:DUF3011 domain-containing protein [Tahibacter harae]
MNSSVLRVASILFLLGPAAALADEVTCESKDSRQVECDLDTRGEVRLVRQLSKSPCVEGESWGLFKHSIWVKDGCRGVFASDDGKRFDDGGRDGRGDDGRGRGDGYGAGYDGRGRDDRGRDDSDSLPDRVTCESRDNRQVECDMNTRGNVRVAQQLSKTACVEGRTWGLNRHSIWVKDGCRAVFERDTSGPRDRDYRRSGDGPDAAPDAAVRGCERAGRGRSEVLTTSALKPGYWEVILRYDDGRYVCNVDDRGNVSEFTRIR